MTNGTPQGYEIAKGRKIQANVIITGIAIRRSQSLQLRFNRPSYQWHGTAPNHHHLNSDKRIEAAREALKNYRILDTAPEQSYDDIIFLAAQLCVMPIALISLVEVDAEHQWFKSRVGVDAKKASRNVSFCAHAILGDDTLVVRDAREDERFRDNLLVCSEPHIVFYAGVPLLTPEGARIGSLCVIDHRPRDLSGVQLRSLEALARQVVLQLELKRVSDQLAGALAHINVMEELIPICSYCKSIRNDDGYWGTVEAFIKSHDNVEFSHGLCEACMAKHLPEVPPLP